MKKHKNNPIKRQIRRYKRLFRLRKKKLIIRFCTMAAMLIGCIVALAITTKSPEPKNIPANSTAVNNTDVVVRDFEPDFDINDTLSRFLSQKSSMEEVIKAFVLPDVRGDDYLVYRNIPFGSHTAEVLLQFENGGLYKASVAFDPTDDTDFAKTRFDELEEILEDKFSEPTYYEQYAYTVRYMPEMNITMNMSNHDDNSPITTAIIYTYTAHNAPEPTKPERSEVNADMDYDSLWGLNKNDVMNRLGIPDISGEDYLVYKNILFDEYNSSVMYCFEAKHLTLVCVVLDPEADDYTKRFNDLNDLLTERYGDPYEHTPPHNNYGHSRWTTLENSASLALSMIPSYWSSSGVDATTITYRHNPNYLISQEKFDILNAMLKAEPEPTEPATEPPAEIKRGTDINANIDYSKYMETVYSGDISDVLGPADVGSEDFLLYENMLFGAYGCKVRCELGANGIERVKVTISSTNDSVGDSVRAKSVKDLLIRTYGKPDATNVTGDYTSFVYSKWHTPNMTIVQRNLAITYTPNTGESAEPDVPDRPVDDFTEKDDVPYETKNANINYDDLWGVSMEDFMEILGTADEHKKSYDGSTDFLFYRKILFGSFNSSVLCDFNYNDSLFDITVTFPYMSENADMKNCYVHLKQSLNDIYGDAVDGESYSYSEWVTDKTYVKLELRDDNLYILIQKKLI